MRFGLFLNFEHSPGDDSAATFAAQADLAVKAEALGYEELWVSEHHFNAFSQSPSILPLMAYLAARTHKIRIGAAAILPPLHNPIRVAEDLATIDILSGGRLDIGLARGGPFVPQYKHFQIAEPEAAEQTREASAFLLRLLRETDVSFKGRWYDADCLTTWPRPVQKPLPVWVASYDEANIKEAARNGFGLMAGHAASPAKVAGFVATYQGVASGADPRFVVLRNACIADSDAQAQELARPAIERFIRGMRPMFAAQTPVEAPIPDASYEGFLAHALIGSPETCRRKLAELCAAAPIGSIALKQTWLDPARNEEMIARFRHEVFAAVAA
jgi:alkanesulfonate monooxygenase SsuD/methylene tetrahydromethanopterin reductase-like flavin-dependent oxidoreductase (luciferase family)